MGKITWDLAFKSNTICSDGHNHRERKHSEEERKMTNQEAATAKTQ